MKKTAALAAILLYATLLIVTVSAQTDTATPEPNLAANIFGTIIAIIALIIVIAIIVFAGYKILKKWSTGQSD
jgi:heme/copper-type cytochrome/quinol oxidase subunit 2